MNFPTGETALAVLGPTAVVAALCTLGEDCVIEVTLTNVRPPASIGAAPAPRAPAWTSLPRAPPAAPTPAPKAVCVVTGQPAKYRCPRTGQPYATVEAFAKIRASHPA